MRMARLLILLAGAAPGVALAQKPAPMAITPWASLAPAPGAVEARLGMRAQASRPDDLGGTETITVIGHKRAPIEAEELRREAPNPGHRTRPSLWCPASAIVAATNPAASINSKKGCSTPFRRCWATTRQSWMSGPALP